MSEKQKIEYIDGVIGFLNRIDADDEVGRDILKLIYYFSRSGYREYIARNGGAANE